MKPASGSEERHSWKEHRDERPPTAWASKTWRLLSALRAEGLFDVPAGWERVGGPGALTSDVAP